MEQIGNSNLRYIKAKEVEIFMIHIIITEEIIKIGIDQIAEIGEFNLVDKIEVGQSMNRIIGMIMGEKILEVAWEHIKILEDRIVEDIRMRIVTGVGVVLEKDHFQETLIIEEMTEA